MSDLIDRRAAIDDLHGKDPSQIWDTADVEVWINELPSVQPDHTADIGKKVSISCGRENDLISRQEALKELAVYIHLIDKTMGKGTLTDDDCMEAAKSVLGEDELPAVQPDHVADISKKVADEDCISRRAAIDDMKDALDPHIVQFVKAKMAIEALPSVQPEPHWIPCSDRLPEEQRYCLTSCRNGLVCEDFHWNNGYFDKADKYHHEVIAWMPLPEPYRGGDSNE